MKNEGRIGSHAISTIDFSFWANEPIVQMPHKIKKTKVTKDIIYKIFDDCAVVTEDKFWAEKFNNAAIGKFPPKFSFNDGLLIFKKGAKCLTLEVSNNPYEASNACIQFFHTNGGIFSELDERNSAELQYERTREALNQEPLTWGNANKKVQENILCYYIENMKNLMKLEKSEAEELRQVIQLGIVSKHFGKHNINIENNRIHSITGLLWNAEARTFYIDPNIKPVTSRTYERKANNQINEPSEKDTIPQFGSEWDKYLDIINKKILINSRQKITIYHEVEPQYYYFNIGGTSVDTTALTETTNSDS